MTQSEHHDAETSGATMAVVTASPACGEPDIMACPGLKVTLSRHPHVVDREEGQRHSNGALGYRAANSADDANLLESLDTRLTNWCHTCQRTLLTCNRAFCRHAREEIAAFVYVATEYALVQARRGHPRWDGAIEDVARAAADRKAWRVVKMRSSNPEVWDPDFQLSSVVNWISGYTAREAREKVGDYLKKRDADPLVDRRSSGRDIAEQVTSVIENQLLSDEWRDLTQRMLNLVADLPPRGTRRHRPETFLRWYQAQYAAWRYHGDGRYAPEKKSDRQLAVHLGDADGYNTVSRFRRNDLVPALSAFRDGELTPTHHSALTGLRDNPALTIDQHAALTVLLDEGAHVLSDHDHAALSTLDDTPGLADTQYAALAALADLRDNPLTPRQQTAVGIFIHYVDGNTIHIDKRGEVHLPHDPATTNQPDTTTEEGGLR